MRRLMMKSAMGVSAFIVALLGPAVAGPDIFDPFIISLIVLMLAWAGIEFYIGFSRPVEGIEPSHPAIKISRMLWLMFVVYSWLDLRNGWTISALPSWSVAALLSFCVIALAIRISAIIHLGKSFSYDVRRPAGNALICTGPYRFIRHPAYLGIIILATLPGLIVGSVVGFIGLALTTLVQTLMRIKAEDKMLAQEFGEAFREYARKTKRLLPFVY